jgi:late competence protein required for DNA uptake (superfamily II DNA/RNA helicase)
MFTNTKIKNLETQLKEVQKSVQVAWDRYFDIVHLFKNTKNYVIPNHIKLEFVEMMKLLKKHEICPICKNNIQYSEFEITECGHFYCKECLVNLKISGYNTCSVCSAEFVEYVIIDN